MKRSIRTGLIVSAALSGMAAAQQQVGEVYLAAELGLVYQLDLDTGELGKPIAAGGPVEDMVVQGRDLLAATSDNRVFRVDLDTGVTDAGFLTSARPLSMVRYADTLYMGTEGADVQWVEADGGDQIDTYYLHDTVQAMTMFGNTVYAGSHSTLIYRSPVGMANFEPFTACGGRVSSMATDGVDLLVGSLEGTIYVFDATTGGYKATYPVASDCVAMTYADGDLLIAGTDGLVHRMTLANGAISRVYDTGLGITAMTVTERCPADFNGDGESNTLDFLDFLNAWTAGDSSADIDENGVVNTQDVLVFLNAFTSGCS